MRPLDNISGGHPVQLGPGGGERGLEDPGQQVKPMHCIAMLIFLRNCRPWCYQVKAKHEEYNNVYSSQSVMAENYLENDNCDAKGIDAG